MSNPAHTQPPMISEPSESTTDAPAFFSKAGYRAVVDELVHLCQFGNSLVALLAKKGMGKTTVLNETLSLLGNAQCCYISGKSHSSIEVILARVAQEFAVPISPQASAGEMLSAIRRSIPAQSLQHRVIVIDDADVLSDTILSSVVSLLQGQQGYQLHVLLAGDIALAPRLDKFEMSDLPIYDLELKPLTNEECEQYIAHRLEGVEQYAIEDMDSATIERMWKQSKGVPLVINSLLNQYIVSQEIANAPALDPIMMEEEEARLPYVHMGMMVVLLSLLILGLIYLSSDEPEVDVANEVEPAIITNEPVNEPIVNASEPVIAAEPEPVVEPASEFNPVIPETESAAPVTEPVVSDPAPAPVSEVQEPTVVSQPEPIEPEPVVAKKPEPKPAAAPKPEPVQTPVKTSAFSSWPGNQFVLQVTASSSKSGIEKFVANQSNKSDLTIVTTDRNGKPWYVVVAGPYADRASAVNAINRLPQSQVNAGPWPRTVSSLQ